MMIQKVSQAIRQTAYLLIKYPVDVIAHVLGILKNLANNNLAKLPNPLAGQH